MHVIMGSIFPPESQGAGHIRHRPMDITDVLWISLMEPALSRGYGAATPPSPILPTERVVTPDHSSISVLSRRGIPLLSDALHICIMLPTHSLAYCRIYGSIINLLLLGK